MDRTRKREALARAGKEVQTTMTTETCQVDGVKRDCDACRL